jgi:hypothetical protein
MPKSRKADKPAVAHCSFCGEHKDVVPLIVTSIQTNACICSWCALGVVEQSFKAMIKMEGIIRAAYGKPQIEVVPAGQNPDKLDVAISKALNP